MIQILNNRPENVVGIQLPGDVTKNEYDSVYPKVEKLAKIEGEINYLK